MPEGTSLPKWFLTFLGSLFLLGVSSFATVLYHRVGAFESRLHALEKLVAGHAERHTQAANVVRRMYEHQQDLEAVMSALKERLSKLETHHDTN